MEKEPENDFPTREDIIAAYPLQETTFTLGNRIIVAKVSKKEIFDDEGNKKEEVVLYVEPGSTRVVEEEKSEK